MPIFETLSAVYNEIEAVYADMTFSNLIPVKARDHVAASKYSCDRSMLSF
jgi:hypothetical protein